MPRSASIGWKWACRPCRPSPSAAGSARTASRISRSDSSACASCWSRCISRAGPGRSSPVRASVRAASSCIPSRSWTSPTSRCMSVSASGTPGQRASVESKGSERHGSACSSARPCCQRCHSRPTSASASIVPSASSQASLERSGTAVGFTVSDGFGAVQLHPEGGARELSRPRGRTRHPGATGPAAAAATCTRGWSATEMRSSCRIRARATLAPYSADLVRLAGALEIPLKRGTRRPGVRLRQRRVFFVVGNLWELSRCRCRDMSPRRRCTSAKR